MYFKSRNLDLHLEFMLVLGYILLYAFINLFKFQENHSYPCFGSISGQQTTYNSYEIPKLLPH